MKRQKMNCYIASIILNHHISITSRPDIHHTKNVHHSMNTCNIHMPGNIRLIRSDSTINTTSEYHLPLHCCRGTHTTVYRIIVLNIVLAHMVKTAVLSKTHKTLSGAYHQVYLFSISTISANTETCMYLSIYWYEVLLQISDLVLK